MRLANNGREALALAEEGAFDLLLLDVHMPELDGFQVIQAIRERERTAGGHLPVIALTARSRKEDRERCLAAGMDDFLAKPIQAADLWAAIDRVVGVPVPPADRAGTGPARPAGAAGRLRRRCGRWLREMMPGLPAYAAGPAGRGQRAPCGRPGRARGCARPLTSFVGCCRRSPRRPVPWRRTSKISGRGQLEEARPLVEQLEAMARELMGLAGGLSLEELSTRAAACTRPQADGNP